MGRINRCQAMSLADDEKSSGESGAAGKILILISLI